MNHLTRPCMDFGYFLSHKNMEETCLFHYLLLSHWPIEIDMLLNSILCLHYQYIQHLRRASFSLNRYIIPNVHGPSKINSICYSTENIRYMFYHYSLINSSKIHLYCLLIAKNCKELYTTIFE